MFCGRQIPFDSVLCPYCGKTFNKLQNLINTQKVKRINIARINDIKRELIQKSFKPVKIQMSDMVQPKELDENISSGYKSKLIMYLLIFSIFITMFVVVIFVLGFNM